MLCRRRHGAQAPASDTRQGLGRRRAERLRRCRLRVSACTGQAARPTPHRCAVQPASARKWPYYGDVELFLPWAPSACRLGSSSGSVRRGFRPAMSTAFSRGGSEQARAAATRASGCAEPHGADRRSVHWPTSLGHQADLPETGREAQQGVAAPGAVAQRQRNASSLVITWTRPPGSTFLEPLDQSHRVGREAAASTIAGVSRSDRQRHGTALAATGPASGKV
jgi:hypothetical protein